MAKSRVRKNRGKGRGAQARRAKVRDFNARQRELHRRASDLMQRVAVESVIGALGRGDD